MISQEYCTGCAACSVICPQEAITMRINQYGFYSAFIRKEKCTECQLCERVCVNKSIDITMDTFPLAQKGVYMAYSKQMDSRSSSGGVAYEIMRAYNELGYSVCGVVYDHERREAKNSIAKSFQINKLQEFRGSKYLQSNSQEAFRHILNETDSVIIGTPCQIYGIRKALQFKKCCRMLYIDFFCYGVPSYSLWHCYLEYIQKKYHVSKNPTVVFRTNALGWRNRQISVGDKYKGEEGRDFFYRMFCKDPMCLNLSCYKCPFKDKSSADIRLGDFWGPKYHNSFEGRSMVCINTSTGQEIYEKIKERIISQKETKECIALGQGFDNPKLPNYYYRLLKDLKENRYLPLIYKKYSIAKISSKILNKIRKVINGKRKKTA